jgi:hypothetical protein
MRGIQNKPLLMAVLCVIATLLNVLAMAVYGGLKEKGIGIKAPLNLLGKKIDWRYLTYERLPCIALG